MEKVQDPSDAGTGFRVRNDLEGQRYGDLLVVQHVGFDRRGNATWECVCTCGRTLVVAAPRLRDPRPRRSKTRCDECKGVAVGVLRRKDLSGQRFGRWTVVALAEQRQHGQAAWLCRCDCGSERELPGNMLRSGDSKSCGCGASEAISKARRRHGGSNGGSLSYQSWASMRLRCRDPGQKCWKDYGGRGIRVCERWDKSFEAFLADMGERPSLDHSLDRFPDNNGNYEPGNCRWATRLEQRLNARNAKVTADLANEIVGRSEHGEEQRSIALRLGVSKGTVSNIILGKSWADATGIARKS